VALVTHRKKEKRRSHGPPAHHDDVNMRAAGLLHDMAALQSTERSRFGYKRAAKAIVGLPVRVTDLVAAGTLREVPFVGPASARIITELVEAGTSSTVASAIAASTRAREVAARQASRRNVLSHVAMELALGMPLDNGIVGRGTFRGDFQMHSTWSDGAEAIATMAEACLAAGHACMGVTDHSYGLPIARGMSMADVARQHREIDRLNEAFAGRFRIFKGIEANILADGSLDLELAERRLFEFVVASPHSALRRSDDQTARMLAAVRAPAVAILGHPRGRVYDSRAGVVADWPRIFREAAARGVAVELDGNWHRQDLDFELARQALEAGCIFALDSDAHSIGELRFTDYAIAHARLAGIPSELVINCWSERRLDEWMDAKRS
jgi:histidinol phosphatase-like PHP family hydrolase